MAIQAAWKGLKYFKPDENWGPLNATPEQNKWASKLISPYTLHRLDEMRGKLGTPFIPTCGVDPRIGAHAKESYHRPDAKGGPSAVDGVIPFCKLSPIDVILLAEKFGFTGIGFYVGWKYEGKAVMGLHLDYRPLDGYMQARWLGVPIEGKQTYIAMNEANIRKYCYP